jgi:hypothetical protein
VTKTPLATASVELDALFGKVIGQGTCGSIFHMET